MSEDALKQIATLSSLIESEKRRLAEAYFNIAEWAEKLQKLAYDAGRELDK